MTPGVAQSREGAVASPVAPADLFADVLLADGRVATIRPIRTSDKEALRQFHSALSAESQRLRFFSVHPVLGEAELDRFVTVDYLDRLALVALVAGRLSAVARYDRVSGSFEAEVAFTVLDELQGKGLGTILLEHLAAAAMSRGIKRFVADVLADNRKMLEVFRRAGFDESASFEGGVVRVVLDLEPSEDYRRRVEERDQAATARSIARLLRPSSIALVGASRRSRTIGNSLLKNILAGGFKGPVYPVNPAGGTIEGLASYASVREIPGPVDLAVIAVPAPAVQAVLEDCGAKDVGGAVVISAGFAETGPAGAEAEAELLRTARQYGIRLIGPNCMGVVNMAADVSMNATFAPTPPVGGHIAFSSQSGGLGIAILNEAATRGLGISTFVSVGNKADVSGNDLLQYWEQDGASQVILLYLESFGNPRKFARIARRVSRVKPIVAVKSGRSASGSRGASSHTAAIATSDAEVDALFRQAGVIRVDTLEELFDVADLLSHQPLPKGGRVAIVGNAGGPGVLAADACERYGLAVPELAEATQATLRAFLSPEAAVNNPVDCIASATAEDYKRALEAVLADDGIDAAIVIFTPPLVTDAEDVARAVAEVSGRCDKPVLANFLAAGGVVAELQRGRKRVPWFAYPESAARTLGHVVGYAGWRSQDECAPVVPADIDRLRGRRIVEEALAASAEAAPWLSAGEVHDLLLSYGIRHIETVGAATVSEAVRVAERLGFPVALKVEASGVVHKSDAGGVKLGLASADAVFSAATGLLGKFGPAASLIVQPMAPAGVEVIAGLVQDASFGPVLLVGMGGTLTELLGDHVLSLVPMSEKEARRLLLGLKLAPLLTGYRGAPPGDIDGLVDLLCRLGVLAQDLPEVAEMDLNPILVAPGGAIAVDARARVTRQPLPLSFERRRLRSAEMAPEV